MLNKVEIMAVEATAEKMVEQAGIIRDIARGKDSITEDHAKRIIESIRVMVKDAKAGKL